MNYELTEEHKELQSKIRKVVAEEIKAAAAFPDEGPKEKRTEALKQYMKKLAENHFLEWLLGEDPVGCCVIGEELARACPSAFFSALSSALAFGCPIRLFGTEAQKKKYLLPLTKADLIGALALTEPEAGSDLSGIRTAAERKGHRWLLEGAKDLVTNAPLAEAFLVLAWTDREAGLEKGMTFFILDRQTRGLSAGRQVETMGLRGAPVGGIELFQCEVGSEAILGEVGDGYEQIGKIMPTLHLAISMLSLGIGDACLEESSRYARERKAFGKPIGYFEGVGAKLAIMFTLIDLGRMMAHRAAWGLAQGDSEAAVLAACAKLFISESVNKIVDLGMQVHGGHGYLKGAKVEQWYRDARLAELVYGTSEMLRAFIAKDSLDKFKPA